MFVTVRGEKGSLFQAILKAKRRIDVLLKVLARLRKTAWRTPSTSSQPAPYQLTGSYRTATFAL